MEEIINKQSQIDTKVQELTDMVNDNSNDIDTMIKVKLSLSLLIGNLGVLIDIVEAEKDIFRYDQYIYRRQKDRLFDGNKITDRQAEILSKKDTLIKYKTLSKSMLIAYWTFLKGIDGYIINWHTKNKNNKDLSFADIE